MSDQARTTDEPVSENRIVQFIEQWVGVLAHLARYSRSNRLVAKNTRLLYDLLPEMFGARGTLEFAELHGILMANGRPLTPANQDQLAVGAFLFILLNHNLRSLRLARGVTEAEFESLLDDLAAPFKAFSEDGEASRQVHIGRFIRLELQVASSETGLPREAPESVPAPRQTAAPFYVGPITESAIEISRRLASRERQSLDESQVRVIVRVGPVALAGAEVSPVDFPDQSVMTSGDEGATLFLSPGEHELVVRYGEYQIRHTVVVEEHQQVFEIDLQTVFE
ncbi:MAG: hypothetical protein GX444_05085 [Myxococcales bacterium]|nr:hypothetical protein [Myxococcales bacterium]